MPMISWRAKTGAQIHKKNSVGLEYFSMFTLLKSEIDLVDVGVCT
jgi:hypothetical protein